MQLTPELEEVSRRLRVLRDRVIIKPLEYQHPMLITPGVVMQKGIVIALGYGRRERRKVKFNQTELQGGRSLYFEDGDETGRIIPMRLKVGDVVEFSYRNVFVIYEHDVLQAGLPNVGDLLCVWQNGVMLVDPEESLSSAMLWQQSAGYDRDGNFMSGKEAWTRQQ